MGVGYRMADFRGQLKDVYLTCGMKQQQCVLLLSDSQLVMEEMLGRHQRYSHIRRDSTTVPSRGTESAAGGAETGSDSGRSSYFGGCVVCVLH